MQSISAPPVAAAFAKAGGASTRRTGLLGVLGALALGALPHVAAAQGASAPQAISSPQAAASAPMAMSASGTTANFAPNVPPGEWHGQARDYANTRFSPLAEINAGERRPPARSHGPSPTARRTAMRPRRWCVGNTMYLVTPFPEHRLRARPHQAGRADQVVVSRRTRRRWRSARRAATPSTAAARYANGKIIYNLLDDHTVAVDAKTGKEVWRTKMGDVTHGETMTMAPFVVGNKVYVGNSGGELGVWGWLAALDVDTGKEVWRALQHRHRRAGQDRRRLQAVLLVDGGQGSRQVDAGRPEWTAPAPARSGAGSPTTPSSTSSTTAPAIPSPRVPAQRPGYNLWTSAMFARDATTGMAKWAYQFTPHDQWDYDGVNENVLLDIDFQGKPRKALVHFDRNAFAYTIDRTTGEVLVAAAVRVPELVDAAST